MLARFRPAVPAEVAGSVWIHACSVGEVGIARTLVQAMRWRFPDMPLLVTAYTASGHAYAQKAVSGAAVAWCPFDHPLSVKGFIRRVRPRALLLVETELWPNMIRLSKGHGAPVAVVNGRVSDKAFMTYKRHSNWLRDTIAQIDLVAVQNERCAARMQALGAAPDRVHVTGSIKFDAASAGVSPEELERGRHAAGAEGRPVVVFGSLRTGEEETALALWRVFQQRSNAPKLIIAPRHPGRAAGLLERFGPTAWLWSQREAMALAERDSNDPLIIDTLGELMLFYAMADVAIVGGSFVERVQGHNPIEPASLGRCVVFGPHMGNFAEPARFLEEGGGAVRVAAEELPCIISKLIDDEARRQSVGQAALAVVDEHKGAADRTVSLLEPLLLENASAEAHARSAG
jgi:3-deoxy-D-manno-octulosonic-acid transferase